MPAAERENDVRTVAFEGLGDQAPPVSLAHDRGYPTFGAIGSALFRVGLEPLRPNAAMA
jgi:hypothetical protein